MCLHTMNLVPSGRAYIEWKAKGFPIDKMPENIRIWLYE